MSPIERSTDSTISLNCSRNSRPAESEHEKLFGWSPVSEGGGVWMGVCAEECVVNAIQGLPVARASSIHSTLRREMKLVRYSRCGDERWSAPDASVVVRGQT